jgi:hypothetical protein
MAIGSLAHGAQAVSFSVGKGQVLIERAGAAWTSTAATCVHRS